MPAKAKRPAQVSPRVRLKLSVLDLCKRSVGGSARDSLEQTLDLASIAESAGYHRFWVAEHHTVDSAHSSPEILLPLLGSRTRKIRIGAGGILLQYYSPLKVAEDFLALEALFPGRIDLGVCRGPGVISSEMALALVSGNRSELGERSFARKARELVTILRALGNRSARSNAVQPNPPDVTPPPVWMLGASARSMRLAATLGTRYAYSLFFGGGLSHGLEYMIDYRARFTPSADLGSGHGSIAVSVICADTELEASRCDRELTARGCYQSNVVGTPRQCAETLKLFASYFDVDEIFVASFVQDPRDRINLYRRLAQAFYA